MTKRKELKTHWGFRGSPLCETEHAQFFTHWAQAVTCKRCVAIAFERLGMEEFKINPGTPTGRLASSEPEMQNIRPPLNDEQQAKRATLWEALKERMKKARDSGAYWDNMNQALKRMDEVAVEELLPPHLRLGLNPKIKIITDEEREQHRKEKTARRAMGYQMGPKTFREAFIEMPPWWKPMHDTVYTDFHEALDAGRRAGKIVMGFDTGKEPARAYVLMDPRLDTRPSYPPWMASQD